MSKCIKILLADDHVVVREGLRMLLEITGEFDVIGEVSDGIQAVAEARELQPDVIVMDIAMPKLNGLEAARRILQEGANPPKILILSAHSDDIYIEQLAAIGVQGFLVKQSSADIISIAIKDIFRGKKFYTPEIGKKMTQFEDLLPPTHLKRTAQKKNNLHLTSREREVLQLIAEGRSNKEIASDLCISIKTVEKHRQSVMKKLNIHDASGLTRYAISAGIIESCVQNTIFK